MAKYSVTVKPGASQTKIIRINDHELTIFLRTKPHDGEANTALIKLLAQYFNVPKTSIRIIRGAKSRVKIIEI